VTKYEGLDPYALQAFKGCHNRVRDGKCPSIAWPRTREGYAAFCREIGPHPVGMQKPSVGRKFHHLGYGPGNIQWEEHRINSVKRRGTKFAMSTSPVVELFEPKFRRGSQEYFEHQRFASLKRWSDPTQKDFMSERMRGNQHAKKKEMRHGS
jgi:hypothetical protein